MDKYTEYYRKQFYQEAREIIENISDDILQVEADPENQELLNSVFRGVHTIKGSAGSFDLEDVSEFTHHLEGLLSHLRDGTLSLTPEMVDVILAGVDHIGKMIDDHAAGRKADIDQRLTERFRSLCASADKSGPEISNLPEISETESHVQDMDVPPEAREAIQEAVSLGLYVFRLRLNYSSDLLANGYDPLIFLHNLRQSCTFYHVEEAGGEVPCIDKFNPLSLYLHPAIYVATALSAEDISDLTFDTSLVAIEPVDIPLDGIGSEPLYEFVDSAVDMLESLEKAVIDYETSGSRDALNDIFRMVHNLKGDADLIGLQEITVFAHTLESLLERLRAGTIHRTFALVDVILQAVDFLRQSVLKLAQGAEIPEFPPVFETLKHYASMKEDLERKQYLLKDVSPDLREVFTEQASQYKHILLSNVPRLRHDHERGLWDEETRRVVTRALRGLAKASEFVRLTSLTIQAEKAIVASDRQDIRTLSDAAEKITAFISGIEGEPAEQTYIPRISSREDQLSEKDMGPEIRTMRIDEQKVDQFTNMIGELLIARNTYNHLVKQLEDAERADRDADVSDIPKIIRSFKENLHLFSRLTNDVHHSVMSLRMIPVRRIFQKFNRVVRDISRKQKKAIQLITGGEDIEIDKKVADMLSDPLIHLVRNACDHGIELPDERNAAGKSEKGTVIIRASQEGSNICISVIDDGRGIDRQRLCEEARKLGIAVDSSETPSLTDLAFMPGLSTRTEVSDISGRGVGMDVVRTTVSSLGGTVSLVSNEGKGTEVVLSIPTTLGIDSVLFVECGNTAYAIPLEHIVETLKIPSKKIKRAGRQMLFHHRGEVLPAKPLETLLGDHLPGRMDQESGCLQKTDHCSMIIVRTVQGKYGLIVDRLDKNMEVAVKPVPGILRGINIIGGVSIMGDGKVFLVLNPEKLFT